MLYKKIIVILLALVFCFPMITEKIYATQAFNDNFEVMMNNLKEQGVDTKFIDGSLRVDKLIIKKYKEKGCENSLNYAYCEGGYENFLSYNYYEKGCENFLDGDYYEKGSNWRVAFNYFKKVENKLSVKLRNIKNFVDQGELCWDKLFYKNLLEEVYVVDLVNANSDTKTTLDNWKYNLQFLTDNYELIKNNKNSNMVVVDKYIEAYLCNLATEDYPDERG